MSQVVSVDASVVPVLGLRRPVRPSCSIDVLLCDEERWQIGAFASHHNLEAGVVLFDEGRAADDIFHVDRGVVMVYKLLPDGRRMITDFVYPGEFIGLSFAEVYPHGAETVTGALLCRLPRLQFERALARMPQLEQRISKIIRNDLVVAQERLLLLGRKTAIERVASFLLDLSRRAALRNEVPTSLWMPMGREAIGDHLGLALETVSRSLSELKRRGLIVLLDDARVELCDPARLRAIAEGHPA